MKTTGTRALLVGLLALLAVGIAAVAYATDTARIILLTLGRVEIAKVTNPETNEQTLVVKQDGKVVETISPVPNLLIIESPDGRTITAVLKGDGVGENASQ